MYLRICKGLFARNRIEVRKDNLQLPRQLEDTINTIIESRTMNNYMLVVKVTLMIEEWSQGMVDVVNINGVNVIEVIKIFVIIRDRNE